MIREVSPEGIRVVPDWGAVLENWANYCCVSDRQTDRQIKTKQYKTKRYKTANTFALMQCIGLVTNKTD